MLNYWWVTRPKRKLDPVPEILATVASETLGNAWQGQTATQLNLEEALERAGLKRAGERRDQSGGGARTYLAWLSSLGLLFRSGPQKTVRLTLAGEDILKGVSPVRVLTAQILRYQFPSPFSLSRSVSVSSRFRIRPFRFLFRLLADPRIKELSQRELGLVVATEAETETNECFEQVVSRILEFRNRGDAALDSDFQERYATSKKSAGANPIANLLDVANTIMNWVEYTQLARTNEETSPLPRVAYPTSRTFSPWIHPSSKDRATKNSSSGNSDLARTIRKTRGTFQAAEPSRQRWSPPPKSKQPS